MNPWLLALSSLVTNGMLGYFLLRSRERRRELEAQVKGSHTPAIPPDLAHAREQYELIRKQLGEVSLVETWHQPVVLLGPREVGKTSLVRQWEARWRPAWNRQKISPTFEHRFVDIPVYDVPSDRQRRPHILDESLQVPYETHLVLRVHDFPGEIQAQPLVEQIIQRETVELSQSTEQRLGVVIVCMFDASELETGIQPATYDYYTADLFKHLYDLVVRSQASIERLVLVYNKIDRLRAARPNDTDADLRDECNRVFLAEFRGGLAICDRERVCSVVTMLDQNSSTSNNQGAPAVMAEAARGIVSLFGGEEAVKNISVESGAAMPMM